MSTLVYDKTDKGREEIATRKNQIAPRLRSLLVMIDGRMTEDTLLKNVAGLGVSQHHIEELLHADYITVIGGTNVEPAPPPPPVRSKPGLRARPPGLAAAAQRPDGAGPDTLAPGTLGSIAPEPVAPPPPAQAPASAVNEPERLRHLHEFYNQTIKSTVGLRGIMLQLKAEKCSTLDEFRALRQPYLEAVLKAKGSEMAHSLRGRLDHLLGGRPDPDPFVLPGD